MRTSSLFIVLLKAEKLIKAIENTATRENFILQELRELKAAIREARGAK